MQEDNKLFFVLCFSCTFEFVERRSDHENLIGFITRAAYGGFRLNPWKRTACPSKISGNLKSLFSLLFCYICLYFCLRRAQFIKYPRFSSREGISGNSWRMGWGECAGRFSKSLPYFRPIPIRQMWGIPSPPPPPGEIFSVKTWTLSIINLVTQSALPDPKRMLAIFEESA